MTIDAEKGARFARSDVEPGIVVLPNVNTIMARPRG
jgi:hypothetical protein